MLASIEHQQQAPVGERLRHTLRRSFAAAKLQPDSGGHRGGDQAGIGKGRELGQPHAVGEVRPQLADVYDQIKTLSDSVGGFGNLLMFGQGGFLDHKDTIANITLFAKEVLPRLRELNPEPQRAAAAE
jgi:hypothetical protein